jgi:ornithine cyclodeaminase
MINASDTGQQTVPFIVDEIISEILPHDLLIESLRTGLSSDIDTPLRQVFTTSPRGDLFLQMPVWIPGRFIVTKLLTIFPENRTLPTVQGCLVVFDGADGRMIAIVSAQELTLRRTAAASALAANSLARLDAKTLLVVGTGSLAPHLARAHATRRTYDEVLIWGRSPDKAEAMAQELRTIGLPASATGDLENAQARADVITCATTSHVPLIKGELVPLGAHVDLVGGFTREMREADDHLIARCSLFGDDIDAVASSAGDIVIPMERGLIARSSFRGDLKALALGVAGRRTSDEITVYKSVGFATLDLIAAVEAVRINSEREPSR